MSDPVGVEAHLAVEAAPELGEDIYRNRGKLVQTTNGVYGAGLISQTMSAASKTVSPEFYIFAVQSTFPNAARGDGSIVYHVQRTADSRTYATRTVRAVQKNPGDDTEAEAVVYTALVSFQHESRATERFDALSYGLPFPDLDGLKPDDVPKEAIHTMMATDFDESKLSVQLSLDEQPFDWRPCGVSMTDEETEFRIHGFVKAAAPLAQAGDRATQIAALGYLSDEYLLGVSFYPNARKLGKNFSRVLKSVSMTHDIHIHDPNLKVDDWLLGQRHTSWGDEGRVMIHQRFWNVETGRMVMTSTQTAVIRLKQKL